MELKEAMLSQNEEDKTLSTSKTREHARQMELIILHHCELRLCKKLTNKIVTKKININIDK